MIRRVGLTLISYSSAALGATDPLPLLHLRRLGCRSSFRRVIEGCLMAFVSASPSALRRAQPFEALTVAARRDQLRRGKIEIEIILDRGDLRDFGSALSQWKEAELVSEGAAGFRRDLD